MVKIRLRRARRVFLVSVIGVVLATSANANDLFRALKTAKAGETIQLGASDLGAIHLRNLRFEEPVTIIFSSDTKISRLKLENVQGLILNNMTLIAGTTARPQAEKAVRVIGGSHIDIRNSTIQWSEDGDPLNDGSAIMVDGVDHFTLADSTISNAENAIHVRGSSHATVSGNLFHTIMVDGIILSGTKGAILENNSCADFTTASSTLHPDCIQLQAGGRKNANTSVIIRGNSVRNGNGARTQGIFVKSRFDDTPHKDIIIEDNVIEIAKGNGIYAKSVIGLTIRGNLVRPSMNAAAIPRIVIRSPAQDVMIEANTAPQIVSLPDTIMRDNRLTGEDG